MDMEKRRATTRERVRRWRQNHSVTPMPPCYIPPPFVTPVLTVEERKQRLSLYATEGNLRFTNPVAAIAELNKMEGVYPPERHLVAQKVVFEIIYRGGETKELPEETNKVEEREVGTSPLLP